MVKSLQLVDFEEKYLPKPFNEGQPNDVPGGLCGGRQVIGETKTAGSLLQLKANRMISSVRVRKETPTCRPKAGTRFS